MNTRFSFFLTAVRRGIRLDRAFRLYVGYRVRHPTVRVALCPFILFHLATGGTPMEYILYAENGLSGFDLLRVMTTSRMNQIKDILDPVQWRDVVDDKWKCIQTFGDAFARECVCTQGDYQRFLRRHSVFFVKALDGYGGSKVKKINQNSLTEEQTEALQTTLAQNTYVLEECVSQTGFLHLIHPQSINTVRIVTLHENSQFVLAAAFFRSGVADLFVDNRTAGGILWLVDTTTGTIQKGVSSEGVTHEVHPNTQIRVTGQVVPRFCEATELCIGLHRRVPGLGFIGWDVAISDNGISIIEANSGTDLYSFDCTLWPRLKQLAMRSSKDIR